MSLPVVTVLMPVHNGAEHLLAALDSVVAQDFADFELLVVDDGSDDDTPEILAGYDDPRLRVLRLERTGLIGALNRGLDEARGELIARLDADDAMLPGRLGRQVEQFRRDPRLVACGADYLLFGAAEGVVRTPRSDADCRAHLVFGSPIAHPAVMLRAGALRAGGVRYRADYPHAEDFKLFSELAEVGTLANLAEPGLRYRVHAGQISQLEAGPQRAMHLRICAENLAARGITMSVEKLERLLWPCGGGLLAALRYALRSLPEVVLLGWRSNRAAGVRQALIVGRERLRALLSRSGAAS
ncbi:MAG: glycosyltransferase family A protein [Micropruina sp.]|uniref:glycosyltransferase family 2 protein n=1 Tax=Micropruina sp. TaxID=2737536 RepID=UPI0039E6DA16